MGAGEGRLVLGMECLYGTASMAKADLITVSAGLPATLSGIGGSVKVHLHSRPSSGSKHAAAQEPGCSCEFGSQRVDGLHGACDVVADHRLADGLEFLGRKLAGGRRAVEAAQKAEGVLQCALLRRGGKSVSVQFPALNWTDTVYRAGSRPRRTRRPAGIPNSRPYRLGTVRHVLTYGALVVTMSSCQRR